MTRLEIIEDTVAYYSEDVSRRSLGEEGCKYFSENGNRCAVGRYCKPEGEEYLQSKEYYPVDDIELTKVVDYFPDEVVFWDDLQELHDYEYYWNKEGLTAEGLNYVNALKAKYKDDSRN